MYSSADADVKEVSFSSLQAQPSVVSARLPTGPDLMDDKWMLKKAKYHENESNSVYSSCMNSTHSSPRVCILQAEFEFVSSWAQLAGNTTLDHHRMHNSHHNNDPFEALFTRR